MSNLETEGNNLNFDAWKRLRRELEKEYVGQFVGIVGGEVVAIAPTFEEIIARLSECEPNPSRRLVLRVGDKYPKNMPII